MITHPHPNPSVSCAANRLHRSIKTAACFALCLASFQSTGLAQSAAEPRELFDGKSLSGWEGDPQHWRVEGGNIVGEIPAGQTLRKNTWLVWRGGELTDFDLRLQVKLTGAPAANSGIQFRCQVRDVDHVSGYQADLDQGATWLGRIYDEHGRALLTERGTRVVIDEQGKRTSETFAPANQFAVLFRDNAWNDYRIVAIGERISVYVNGTLFSELHDQQTLERDLSGSLAFQLHSGPQTRVEFRNIRLETLKADDTRLGKISIRRSDSESAATSGVVPSGDDGKRLNLGFETGTLAGWKATGDAFGGQPVESDSIASRWAGQTSNKQGNFFIGGFEIVKDSGVGTLTSPAFRVTHPYASFLIGGGDNAQTRAEVVLVSADDGKETTIFTAVGDRREQMRRVGVDLRGAQDQRVLVRLFDENPGAWGHLNFDDFRFHDQRPHATEPTSTGRSTQNPLLHHLVPNPTDPDNHSGGVETAAQMHVPDKFSVTVVASEPRLHQPMAFTFDAKGRLWVVEGYSYPKKRPKGEGLDRILIFSDDDGDGDYETRKVFAEGLNLVSGLEVGYGGVWVGAAPEMLFIPDRDGDDRPDSPPQVLLEGFGYADTHETLNSLMWGPDGWLYGNQGVFNTSSIGKPESTEDQRVALSAGVWRYHPTRHQFEVFAHGGSNQWGLDYDQFGQLFMTHCRSRWGQGPTTHVVQGGHYWNQVNNGYAPFISATAPPNLPAMRNYMLASARYGHGEGGAGKKGSRQVFGGHSHVGTMIYLGDNWPDEYRNHLFTHNLHGHQINHQVNLRQAGGFNTVHAGYDVLLCADPQYIGIDLKYGPDGAVYISDWYDPRNCHNPNVEQWDRGNGRLYRMQYDPSYQPASVDYAAATDEELVDAQLHNNAWHARTARRVLSERHAGGQVSDVATRQLRKLALTHAEPTRRLRAVWSLHAIGAIDGELADRLLEDESEYVRAWTVQLAVETLPPQTLQNLLGRLAKRETSLLVRRYLASAIPRVPSDLGWILAETLSAQQENASDRELPLLLWYGLAGLLSEDVHRAFALAESTQIPALGDYVDWYAAKLSHQGRNLIAQRLADAPSADRIHLLTLMELGVRGMRDLPQPSHWSNIAPQLYDASDIGVKRAAESLGAAFGDEALYGRMRQLIADPSSTVDAKRHAISILRSDSAPQNLTLLLALLDNKELVSTVFPLLTRYDDPAVATELIARLPQWQGRQHTAAMEVLSSRALWAAQVLDGIAAGDLDKKQLTAYHVRQMSNLGNAELNDRLTRQWGTLKASSDQRRAEIRKMVEAYTSAPLWAYNASQGAKHFKKLCAACHQPNGQDESLGPKLAGTRSKGIEYIVENVIDPNAVIGRDFQARMVLTDGGRVINGLVEKKTESAVTIRTATGSVTIAEPEIAEIRVSENSFMPEGLLKDQNDRERIELFKYLMSM